jgi:cysteinyl-tRNA synthetase
MRLTNTLTGELEELAPLVPGQVGIYVCGVTPYAESHVGHAMAGIVYDVLVRYLRWASNLAGGYDVTYVSNYTDIDDNVIERAAELGRDPLELVAENIDVWEGQQRALNLTFPDVRPRVTEHIETIVAAVEAIVERGYGYVTYPQEREDTSQGAGDVYFRVRAKDDYGKLSHRNIEQLRSGTRFEPGEGKEFALDFALWKAAKPGEPSWPSPWGEGRPGWHIECSAMSQHYLGETFDIHGGGLDLVFPHHENEVAQAEAATTRAGEDTSPGGRFARLWLHNGLVQRDGEKMSKSLGNVVTVREALERWRPDALRLFVLGGHYRSPNNLTDEAMAAAEAGVDRLLAALRESPSDDGEPLDATAERERFVAAMEDDLGTPQALAAVFELARAVNRGRDAGHDVAAAQATLGELAREVLGLRLEERAADEQLDAVALSKLASRHEVACGGSDAESTIEALLAARQEARAARDFERADAIRADLAAAGVEVEDTPAGPRWSVARG